MLKEKLTDRAHVICHMMVSADNKTDSGVEGVDLFDVYMPTYNKIHDSFHAQAWMCGRKTMEMFAASVGTSLEKINSEIPQVDYLAKTDAKQYAIAVDTKGLLRWTSDQISDNVGLADHLIVIVTLQTPKEYLHHLQAKKISYVISQSDKVDFNEVLKTLKQKFGIQKVLLEGGGILNGSMVNVIDEVSVLKTPIVANNPDAHSFFGVNEVESNKLWMNFLLIEEILLENGLSWLRYQHK